MSQQEQQENIIYPKISLIQDSYNGVPIKTLLKGYRKKIIEIINNSVAITDVHRTNLRSGKDLIVECGSRASAVSNINLLRGMWESLLFLTANVASILQANDEIQSLNGDPTLTVTILKNVVKLCADLIKYLKDTAIPNKEVGEDVSKDETPIVQYVKALDAYFPFVTADGKSANWEKIVTYGVFKQLYTQVYCTVCDYNAFAREGKKTSNQKTTKPINVKIDTTHKFNGHGYREVKDVTDTIATNKIKNIASWIDSRWDWRIPICCIDKMIVLTNTNINIPADLYKYIPSLVYLSRKCKSTPTAYISNIDFVESFKSGNSIMFLRCSKSIKEGTAGYYFDLVSSYRKVNFDNLTKYNTMSKEVWSHIIVESGLCYKPDVYLNLLYTKIKQDNSGESIVKK